MFDGFPLPKWSKEERGMPQWRRDMIEREAMALRSNAASNPAIMAALERIEQKLDMLLAREGPDYMKMQAKLQVAEKAADQNK